MIGLVKQKGTLGGNCCCTTFKQPAILKNALHTAQRTTSKSCISKQWRTTNDKQV